MAELTEEEARQTYEANYRAVRFWNWSKRDEMVLPVRPVSIPQLIANDSKPVTQPDRLRVLRLRMERTRFAREWWPDIFGPDGGAWRLVSQDGYVLDSGIWNDPPPRRVPRMISRPNRYASWCLLIEAVIVIVVALLGVP